MGCVLSLPGCADQTIHADTPHIYVHTHLSPHYVNLFIPALKADTPRAGSWLDTTTYASSCTAFLLVFVVSLNVVLTKALLILTSTYVHFYTISSHIHNTPTDTHTSTPSLTSFLLPTTSDYRGTNGLRDWLPPIKYISRSDGRSGRTRTVGRETD